MGVIISIVFSFFTSMAGNLAAKISVETVKWLAYKAFWLFVIFVGVPILVYNLAVELMVDSINYAMIYVDSNVPSDQVVELTGIAGWIAQKIYLPQALANFLSFLSIRFTLSILPGFK